MRNEGRRSRRFVAPNQSIGSRPICTRSGCIWLNMRTKYQQPLTAAGFAPPPRQNRGL